MTANNMVPVSPSTPALAESLARPSRLLVAQSAAFNLLKDGEPEEDIIAAMTLEVGTELPIALAGVRYELAPVETEIQLAALIGELSAYLRHGGATMSRSAKDEWLDGVVADLGEFPLSLLLESVPRARKRIRAPWEMVAWVVDDIESATDKLKLEEQRLAKLAEITTV